MWKSIAADEGPIEQRMRWWSAKVLIEKIMKENNNNNWVKNKDYHANISITLANWNINKGKCIRSRECILKSMRLSIVYWEKLKPSRFDEVFTIYLLGWIITIRKKLDDRLKNGHQ